MKAFLIIAVIIGIIFYSLYVRIIKKRNKALEAFSGIDIQLKKRFDLIPNVLKLAKKFMDHEKELLQKITELRTSVQKLPETKNTNNIGERLALEQQLSSKMGSLFVAVENYPDLKSDKSILQAQQTYNEIEEHISAARRFYNSAVNALNNTVQIFPGNMVASIINVESMKLFEATITDRKPVSVDDIM